MKHKDSVTQIYKDRDQNVVPALYKKALGAVSFPSSLKEICEYIATMPTDRYYLSDDAAYNYVRRRYLHGERITYVNKYKQILFESMYERVMDLWQQPRYKSFSTREICVVALMAPAPCVGLKPSEIQSIVRKYLKS